MHDPCQLKYFNHFNYLKIVLNPTVKFFDISTSAIGGWQGGWRRSLYAERNQLATLGENYAAPSSSDCLVVLLGRTCRRRGAAIAGSQSRRVVVLDALHRLPQ